MSNYDSAIQASHELLCSKIWKYPVLYIMVIVYHPPKRVCNYSRNFIRRLTDGLGV